MAKTPSWVFGVAALFLASLFLLGMAANHKYQEHKQAEAKELSLRTGISFLQGATTENVNDINRIDGVLVTLVQEKEDNLRRIVELEKAPKEDMKVQGDAYCLVSRDNGSTDGVILACRPFGR